VGFLTSTLDTYGSRLPAQEAVILRALRGELYIKRGENSKAEDDFNYLLRQSNIAALWRGAILVNLTTLYVGQGQFDKAWKYITQAEALESQIDDKDVLNFIKSTKALLMAAFLEGGSQPIKILQQLVASSTDRHFLSMAHSLLGIIYLVNNEKEQALANARKSVEYLEADDAFHASLLSLSMMTMSVVYSDTGQHQEALQAAQRAVDIANRLGIYSVLGRAKALEGISYYKLQKWSQARAALAEAIKLIEEQGGNLAGGLDGALSYFESMVPPYMTMLDVLYEMKDYDAVVNHIERSKAKVLLDVLSRGSGDKPVENVPASPQKSASNSGKNNQDNRFGLVIPKDASGRTSLLNPDEIKSLLPNPSTALLHYAVTDAHVYLFIFTSAASEQAKNQDSSQQNWRERLAWKAYKLDISKEELEEDIEQLEVLLSDNRSGYSSHCQRLYQRLLKPAALDLAGKTSLIIIPDSVLWGVPFQALQPAEDHFLLEDFVITYAPSMSVLYKMSHSHHSWQPSTKAATAPDILALANPAKTTQKIEISSIIANELIFTIGGQDSQPRPLVFNRAPIRRHVTLKPLPGAVEEVHRLTTIYGRKAVNVLSGPLQTKENFKRLANKYRIIHLATHGILNYQTPLDSAVLIEQPVPITQNQLDNKAPLKSVLIGGSVSSTSQELPSAKWLLSAREVMEMRLQAELVVLSACDTAGGGISEGEGMIGLTWAFAAAGVPTIVASQWAVPDTTTADLMEDFHQRLQRYSQKNRSIGGTAAALTEAARAIAGKREYRHPYYWAAFIVVGNGQ
jgi:CHAT domain-containing protein